MLGELGQTGYGMKSPAFFFKQPHRLMPYTNVNGSCGLALLILYNRRNKHERWLAAKSKHREVGNKINQYVVYVVR